MANFTHSTLTFYRTHRLMAAGVALCAAMLTAKFATAATVFYDDFEDGNRDGWYNTDADGNATSLVLNVESDAPLLGSAHELQGEVGATTAFQAMTAYFPTVTLSSIGDYVTLSFKSYQTANDFRDSGFRFGIFNSEGTKISSDGNWDTNSVSVDDNGYFATVDLGGSTGAVCAEIREDIGDTDSELYSGTVIASLDNDSAPDPLMFSGNTAFTYTFTITLTGANELTIVLANNETSAAEELSIVTTAQVTAFDTLYFGTRHYTTGTPLPIDYRLDDVTILSNVPEPASLALLAIGAAAIVSPNRRKHRGDDK